MKTKAILTTLILALAVGLSSHAVLQSSKNGDTTLSFSSNPATLVAGDDVTITTTTTSTVGQPYIDRGRVQIELATDGTLLDGEGEYIGGNPVPAAEAVYWLALNDPGSYPASGVTTLDVDLDALGFTCGTVAGFRALYKTPGSSPKVDTHRSDAVDLTAECPCEWEGETAWADGDPYNDDGKGNWATYTEYEADVTVTLYAGRTLEAGTVHFSAPGVAGDVTITITLNAGWRFKDVEENVKIQDYADAPSGNPSPGGFDHKGDASASPFSIVVPGNYYYGVHVDVEECR